MQMKSPLQNLDVITTVQNTHIWLMDIHITVSCELGDLILIEMIGWVLVMFYFSIHFPRNIAEIRWQGGLWMLTSAQICIY